MTDQSPVSETMREPMAPKSSDTSQHEATAPKGMLRRILLSLPFQGAVLSVIFGYFVNASNRVWGGYLAGLGDHVVLSPQGIQWADPDAFQNDWFMENAPQPHWFFDLITAFGESVGALGFVYLCFWAIGIIGFGFGTAMLARQWVPKHQWIAAIAVTVATGLMPWSLAGTGTGVIAMALPTVVAANLIVLIVAMLLRRSYIWASALSVVIAIIHVQQGAVIAVILAALIVVDWVTRKRAPKTLIVGLVGTLAFVVFGLRLRPVAANLSDFVDVCNTVIPYHCAAGTWTKETVLATVGLIFLVGFTGFFVARGRRLAWAAILGLPALGLVLGLVVDNRHVPILGELAQGVNVYRLGAMLMPFMVWGLFFPAIALTKKWHRMSYVLAVVWLACTVAALREPTWSSFFRDSSPVLLAMIPIVIGVVVAGIGRLRSGIAQPLAIVLTAVFFLAVAIPTGQLNFGRPLDASLYRSDTLRQWGEQLQEAIPPGEIVTGPPYADALRMISRRATIADCKNVPYGGQAWTDWRTRIKDLGETCGPTEDSYFTMTADELIATADKYASNFIMIEADRDPSTGVDLQENGWTKVLEPLPGVGMSLYASPEAP